MAKVAGLMTNPYMPPKTDVDHTPPSMTSSLVAQLRQPAIAIIFLAVANITFDVYGLAEDIFFPTRSRLPTLGVPDLAILLTLHSLQAVGGIQMLTQGSYRIAYIGAVTCCIPCMSPFWIFGIPFGVWAIRILSGLQAKAAFNAQRA